MIEKKLEVAAFDGEIITLLLNVKSSLQASLHFIYTEKLVWLLRGFNFVQGKQTNSFYVSYVT